MYMNFAIIIIVVFGTLDFKYPKLNVFVLLIFWIKITIKLNIDSIKYIYAGVHNCFNVVGNAIIMYYIQKKDIIMILYGLVT
jgi:hypothetical protein